MCVHVYVCVCAWCAAMNVCYPALLNSTIQQLYLLFVWCVLADVGVDRELCEKDITMDSPGQFLCPSRHGPGSCLHALIELLSETHNSLVREAQRLSHKEDRCVSVCCLGKCALLKKPFITKVILCPAVTTVCLWGRCLRASWPCVTQRRICCPWC